MWRDKVDGRLDWRCAVRKAAANARAHLAHAEERNAKERERYAHLSGVEYNRRLLLARRANGLTRMRQRQLRRETEGA